MNYKEIRKSHVEKVIVKDDSKRILDVGCGSGELFAGLKNDGQLIGIDINRNPMNPFRVVVGDVLNGLPFQDKIFDQIFALEFIEHLPNISDVVSFLKECHRVLKEGGSLIIHTPNRNRWTNRVRNLVGRPKQYPFGVGLCDSTKRYTDLHYWEFTQPELKKILSDNGFNADIFATAVSLTPFEEYDLPIKSDLGRALIVEAVKI